MTLWQLPTYDGTKSYQNLLVEVYGGQTGFDWPSTKLDTITQNNPLDFIRSGYYNYSSGGIGSRSSHGRYWQFEAYSETYARHLYFSSTLLSPQSSYNKGYGFPVRCLVR